MNLTCHCGNVKISVNTAPDELLSCNCSICNRYGALWGYYTPKEVSITTEVETKTYRWGDETTDFHHCPSCGCMTHYTSTENIEEKRVAANFRMTDHKAIDSITIRKFDGADTWEFIE